LEVVINKVRLTSGSCRGCWETADLGTSFIKVAGQDERTWSKVNYSTAQV